MRHMYPNENLLEKAFYWESLDVRLDIPFQLQNKLVKQKENQPYPNAKLVISYEFPLCFKMT